MNENYVEGLPEKWIDEFELVYACKNKSTKYTNINVLDTKKCRIK